MAGRGRVTHLSMTRKQPYSLWHQVHGTKLLLPLGLSIGLKAQCPPKVMADHDGPCSTSELFALSRVRRPLPWVARTKKEVGQLPAQVHLAPVELRLHGSDEHVGVLRGRPPSRIRSQVEAEP